MANQQRVISSGPYSVDRHPMYAGAFLLLFATPVALGSWVGVLFAIPVMTVIVVRLLEEENFWVSVWKATTSIVKKCLTA